MSLHEYQASQGLSEVPFYGLIMAAMRQADSDNLPRLQRAFPEQWTELQARYNAPGGVLEGESRAVPDAGEAPQPLDPTRFGGLR